MVLIFTEFFVKVEKNIFICKCYLHYTFILYYLSILFAFLSHGYWGLSSVFEPTCWYYTTNSVLGYFLFSQNLNLTSRECEKYIFVLWRKQTGNYVTLIMLLICFISVLQYLNIFGRSTLCSFFCQTAENRQWISS